MFWRMCGPRAPPPLSQRGRVNGGGALEGRAPLARPTQITLDTQRREKRKEKKRKPPVSSRPQAFSEDMRDCNDTPARMRRVHSTPTIISAGSPLQLTWSKRAFKPHLTAYRDCPPTRPQLAPPDVSSPLWAVSNSPPAMVYVLAYVRSTCPSPFIPKGACQWGRSTRGACPSSSAQGKQTASSPHVTTLKPSLSLTIPKSRTLPHHTP